jgi:translation initiation factor RLI1
MFDEPSSYLDVKQRLVSAMTIRDMCSIGGIPKYVLTVRTCDTFLTLL